MNRHHLRGIFIFPVFLAMGCSNVTDNKQLVWVSKMYSGGVQCDPLIKFVPPDVKQIFKEAHIKVFKTAIEHYGVSDSCGSPTYAAMHYVLIDQGDIQKAKILGFQEKSPSKVVLKYTGIMGLLRGIFDSIQSN